MFLKGSSIQRKLVKIVLLISGAALLLASTIILTYEFLTFRQTMLQQASTLGQIIAANSTAALAFDNPGDANEILAALKAEEFIVGAGLYDTQGRLFSYYPPDLPINAFPVMPEANGYRFMDSGLVGFEPVVQGNKSQGTLYIKWDMHSAYKRFLFYGGTVIVMMTSCFLVAIYVLSRTLRQQISEPILGLAQTARTVSEHQDYSVRATKIRPDEFGELTDAFNHMLNRIEEQNAALSGSEARVRAVLKSALSAVVVIDASGRIIEWNPRAETMFGWTSAEVFGQDVVDVLVPRPLRDKYRYGLKRFLAMAESTALNRIIEITAFRRDESEFPVELSIGAMEAGDIVSFCGFITDITERKQSETRLQTQLSRMELLDHITRATAERQDLPSIFLVLIRNLEDNLPIDFGCVCLYDPVAEVLTVASVGTRSADLATELVLTDHTRIPIDQNGLSECVQGQLVYEPDIQNAVFPFPKRLAGKGLRSFVAAPLPVEGKVFGVVIAARYAANSFSSQDCEFLRHVSEHVALAAHQAELYSSLQKAYDDLRQTQHVVMQQERVRVLGQMASGIAHDINNAISPIALYTESLLEREPNLSERTRNYLTTIQQAIDDVAKTVLRLREFYREREPQLELAPIDLGRIVQQVLDLTRPRWRDLTQKAGIVVNLQTDLMAELPSVLGVESELRDALTNLVLNAVDAMPDGGTLTVRTRSRTGPNQENKLDRVVADTVILEVGDTGTGMDEETQRRCLEPFFTTKGERGTGLGLAMVFGMAQRHNGNIEIESEVGKGSTVRVIFPVSLPVAESMVFQPAPMPIAERLKILLVDDDPLVIRALKDALESDEHHVTTADGGEAGIRAFETALEGEAFAVVITDLGMPHVDGRKVAAAVKALSPKTPVILLTGWGQRLVAEQEIPAGVDRVLNKPPRVHDLRSALAEVMANYSDNDPPGNPEQEPSPELQTRVEANSARKGT